MSLFCFDVTKLLRLKPDSKSNLLRKVKQIYIVTYYIYIIDYE